MAISMNRIHTKDEVRTQLEIWFSYRHSDNYEFKLKTSVDMFEITVERVTKFERMEE